MSNRKGAVGIIAIIFLVFIFLILMAIFLGDFINTTSQNVIVENGLTGVEAFLVSNMVLWIIVALILGILAFMYFGG